MGLNSKLVNSLHPMGKYSEFEIAPVNRLDYLKNNIPEGVEFKSFAKVFKKDIFIDAILERMCNVDLYYITSIQGRGEELYYFAKRGKYFHGEIVWSAYHDFLPYLEHISHSAVVTEPSWFVGTKNNYTHQLVDHLPNLLYKVVNSDGISKFPSNNVYGSPNEIVKSLLTMPQLKDKLLTPSDIYLNSIGTFTECGQWRIKCIRFNTLHVLKHLSIFKAFALLSDVFRSAFDKDSIKNTTPNKDLLYISRDDRRVSNQQQIAALVESYACSDTLRKTGQMDYIQKFTEISQYQRILLPPGSENINALCFSHPSALLYQMIPVPVSKVLSSPFYSFAGFRYLLPFIHRLRLLPSQSQQGPGNDLNGGTWSLDDIRDAIERDSHLF